MNWPGDLLADARALIHGVTDPLPGLRYLRGRELVIAALADLDGVDQWRVWGHLSRLASAILTALVEHAYDELAAAWGAPEDADGRRLRFSVLGLGKLGGGELSYASDMDIIFVCDPGGRCAGSGRDADAFWNRLAMRIGKRCQDGGLYPI
ncbi:MAG: hypothetical protein ACYTF0_09310, partial [Planctomycetota bacterium]